MYEEKLGRRDDRELKHLELCFFDGDAPCRNRCPVVARHPDHIGKDRAAVCPKVVRFFVSICELWSYMSIDVGAIS